MRDDYYRRHDTDGTAEIVTWCLILALALALGGLFDG
jgi:hypothetical protein